MQNRWHATDPFIAQIRIAVRAHMVANKHTQNQVVKLTGMPQSQLSRFLNGGGKRMTRHLQALCDYAKIPHKPHVQPTIVEQQLSQVLREAIGDNPAAAQALTRIVQVLTPVLRHLPPQAASSGDLP